MPDQQKMKAAGIDYSQGLRRFSNNEELYLKYLKEFPDDSHYKQGRQAWQECDYNRAFECFHALKGAAGALGMSKLYETASLAVEALRKEHPEKAEHYLSELETAYIETCEAVRTLEG